MKRSLENVIKILNDSNLKWWLDYGQLLSLHRSGEPLKWKDDWDFCIVQKDDNSFDDILKKIRKITNVIFERNGKYIRFDILDLSFDFYFCKEDFEKKLIIQKNFENGGFDMPIFFYDRLDTINFDCIELNVPRHLDYYLNIRYGDDWIIPIKKDMSNIKVNVGQQYKKEYYTCLIAGVFDGLHQGHQNLIEHSTKYFDKIKIGVHSNEVVEYKDPPKHSISERIDMIVSKYPNVEIIEGCPLITDKTYLELNKCDYVVFGDENSDNMNKFYPSQEVNHPIDRYPILSSRLVNKQSVKSFCINMKDKEERYIDVLKEMSKIGIYPERFMVNKHEIEKRIKRDGVNEKSNQILESHLRLYKKLSQTDGDIFLILEDDVMVIDNINLEEVISNAPKDWDVIYLGGVNHHEGHPPVIIDDIFYKAKFTFNLHALLVKKSFIPCIIDELKKREFELDVIFAYMQSNGIGNWYGLIEDAIIQDGVDSPTFITTLSDNSFETINKLKGNFNLSKKEPEIDKFYEIPGYFKLIDKFKKEYEEYDVNINGAKVEFRYFCYRYLNVIKNYNLPKIQKGKKLEAVIVETRKLPHLEFIIRNNILKLGSDWSFTVICGVENYDFMKKICKSISSEIKIIKLEISNITIEEYSKLLSSYDFWDMLVGEKILIFQEDSIIFNKNIEDFLKFDYIGAPWPNLFNEESVGNGGLSLRSKSVMKYITSKYKNSFSVLKDIPKKDFNIVKEHCLEKKYFDDLIPEDVYFSVILYNINDFVLPTKEEASNFSTESIFNEKSFAGHNFWISDFNWKNRLYKNTIKQFKCDFVPKNLIEHRGGWSDIVDKLLDSDFHNEMSDIYFYDIMESKFLWTNSYISEKNWVGILHSTPKKPSYINQYNKSNYLGYLGIDEFFNNKFFLKSLENCKMIFVLSDYVKFYLQKKLNEFNINIKVFSLKHPVNSNVKKFNFNLYKNNNDKNIILIGKQLRKLHTFLLINAQNHKKKWLTGTKDIKFINRQFDEEVKYYNLDKKLFFHDMNAYYLDSFEDYDNFLSKNIVFLDLYDASANNTILECIIRNTPIIVKRIPPVVEYLGENYPLYFNNIDEVSELINKNEILKAYKYLKNMDKSIFEIDYFIKELHNIVYNNIEK